jgi:hypothetical protein
MERDRGEKRGTERGTEGRRGPEKDTRWIGKGSGEVRERGTRERQGSGIQKFPFSGDFHTWVYEKYEARVNECAWNKTSGVRGKKNLKKF